MELGLHNAESATVLRLKEAQGLGILLRYSEDRARFWAKVRKGPHCWLWDGNRVGGNGRSKTGGKYGQFTVTVSPGTQAHLYAHRIAWALSHGVAPHGQICHVCDVPLCVNPDHLFVGTQADNNRDASRKGRFNVPHRKAHKVTTAQLVEIDARLAAGESQADVARAYGVSRAWMSTYVKGKRRQYDRPSLNSASTSEVA